MSKNRDWPIFSGLVTATSTSKLSLASSSSSWNFERGTDRIQSLLYKQTKHFGKHQRCKTATCNWPVRLGRGPTCSKEAECIGAGLWVKEEAAWGPEELESSFLPELPALSVLSSTCASGGREDFHVGCSASREEKQMTEQTKHCCFRQNTHRRATLASSTTGHLLLDQSLWKI